MRILGVLFFAAMASINVGAQWHPDPSAQCDIEVLGFGSVETGSPSVASAPELTLNPVLGPGAPGTYAGPVSKRIRYVVDVRNLGTKRIVEIGWDITFADSQTGHEVGREHFESKKRLDPKKRGTLSTQKAIFPPQVVDSAGRIVDEHAPAIASDVAITRIVYADGEEWRSRE